MTNDELLAREGIRDTLAAYNLSGDRQRNEEFLACFTEDALYWSDVFRLSGRGEIRAWLEEFKAPSSGVKLVRHNLTTSRIAIESADTARVRSYYFVVTERGPDHGGVYVDRFRRVDTRWLIAEREIRLDWARPDSRFVPAEALAALAVRLG